MNILQSIANKSKTEERNTEGTMFSSIFGNIRGEEIGNLQLSAVFRSIEILSDSVAVMPIESKYGSLFENVNNMTKYQFLKLIVKNIIVNGNAFAYIHTDDKGNPKKLTYLRPQDVVINYNEIDGTLNYTVMNHQGLSTVYPEHILHFKKLTVNGVEGISLMNYAIHALKLSKLTEESAGEYFDTNNFKGFLTTQDQLSTTKQHEIENNFSFFLKNRSSAVLSGGLQFQQLKQDTAMDAELLEAREFMITEIGRFFGVPKDMLLGNSSAHGLEDAQNEFLMRTLQSYVILIEEEMSKKLLTDVNLNEEALMRLTKKDMGEFLTKMQSSGILTINEARSALGYEPVKGGDKNVIAYTSVEDNRLN